MNACQQSSITANTTHQSHNMSGQSMTHPTSTTTTTTSQHPSSNQQGLMAPMPTRNSHGFAVRPQPRSSDYETDRVAFSCFNRGATDKERNKIRELCTTAITPSIKQSNITKLHTSDSSLSYDISEDATQWK